MKGKLHRVCAECECPQFKSPSGWVCENGHGGADYSLEVVEDYEEQARAWSKKVIDEIKEVYKKRLRCYE